MIIKKETLDSKSDLEKFIERELVAEMRRRMQAKDREDEERILFGDPTLRETAPRGIMNQRQA